MRKKTEDTQATPNPVHEWNDGLDDLDRAVRISTKKVRKFWYIPDLKNTQLRKHRRFQTATPK